MQRLLLQVSETWGESFGLLHTVAEIPTGALLPSALGRRWRGRGGGAWIQESSLGIPPLSHLMGNLDLQICD